MNLKIVYENSNMLLKTKILQTLQTYSINSKLLL